MTAAVLYFEPRTQRLLQQRQTLYDRPVHKARDVREMVSLAEVSDQPEWADCVVRVAECGCRDSFIQLFDHFAPRINSYLRKQGAQPETAEELSQEALLTLWRKAKLYDPSKAAVSTWLFRVARNLMIDHLRKERSIGYDLEHEPIEMAIDDTAYQASEAATLRKSIATLPELQSEVIYKSYFEGKSHSEIAAETGQPLGSVKTRIRTALRTLRKHFDDEVQ